MGPPILEALAPSVRRIDAALLRELADIEPPKLHDACVHYPRAGGKRLRPLLAMLACEAAGGRGALALPLGLALEVIHNFSLIHDDIMDRDATRRGMPSVHAAFGEPTAILAGDTLFTKAFEILPKLRVDAARLALVTKEVAVASREICEGQQLDMEFEAPDREPSVAEYLRMVDRKTASLFRAATKGGALVARAKPPVVRAMARYGTAFGRAFQIRDDLIDLASEAHTGKPSGSDVRAGKKTLVLIEAFARAEGSDLETLRRVVGKRDATTKEVEEVARVLSASGAVAAAEERARVELAAGRRALRAGRHGKARDRLSALLDYAEVRTR